MNILSIPLFDATAPGATSENAKFPSSEGAEFQAILDAVPDADMPEILSAEVAVDPDETVATDSDIDLPDSMDLDDAEPPSGVLQDGRPADDRDEWEPTITAPHLTVPADANPVNTAPIMLSAASASQAQLPEIPARAKAPDDGQQVTWPAAAQSDDRRASLSRTTQIIAAQSSGQAMVAASAPDAPINPTGPTALMGRSETPPVNERGLTGAPTPGQPQVSLSGTSDLPDEQRPIGKTQPDAVPASTRKPMPATPEAITNAPTTTPATRLFNPDQSPDTPEVTPMSGDGQPTQQHQPVAQPLPVHAPESSLRLMRSLQTAPKPAAPIAAEPAQALPPLMAAEPLQPRAVAQVLSLGTDRAINRDPAPTLPELPLVQGWTALSEPAIALPKAPAAALAPRPVLDQIATAVHSAADDTTEITLTPEELGRVSFRLTHSDQGVSIAIWAERPETLALIRRHADMLMTELADRGMGDSQLNFQDQSRGNQRDDQPQTFAVADDSPSPAPVTRRQGNGALDIRF